MSVQSPIWLRLRNLVKIGKSDESLPGCPGGRKDHVSIVRYGGKERVDVGVEQKNAFHFIYCVLLFTKLHIVAGYAA